MNRNKVANLQTRAKYFPALFEVDQPVVVAVGKDWNGPEFNDCQCGGESRQRSGKDAFAPRTTERLKRYLNRVQTTGHTHRAMQLPLLGESFLKSIYFASQN